MVQDIPEDGSLAGLVEPYRGRPQLKDMRVRSKLVGAGTGVVYNLGAYRSYGHMCLLGVGWHAL